MSLKPDDEVACSLLTEELIFGTTRLLGVDEAPGGGKALLVRSTAHPVATPRWVQLYPLSSEDHWREYGQERIAVEAGFGIGAAAAQAMVDALRARVDRPCLDLYLARDEDRLVGAVGRVRLPNAPWARLQEVDVFPPWRGRGYGDALLAAIVDRLAGEGCTMVSWAPTRTTGPCLGTADAASVTSRAYRSLADPSAQLTSSAGVSAAWDAARTSCAPDVPLDAQLSASRPTRR